MGALPVLIRNWWDRSDKTQRIVTLGGAGFFVLLIIGILIFSTRPHFTKLLDGLSPSDENEVTKALAAKNIPEQHATLGEVDVPEGMASDAMLAIASSTKLSKNVHLGDDNLQQMNLMTTPAQERARLLSIIEGDLATTIEKVEGVSSATVHIAPGDESQIVDERRPTTASVMVVENGSDSVSPDQAHAIARLVSLSVVGLAVENVGVTNERGEILYDGQDANGIGSQATHRMQMETEYNRRRAKDIQTMLDRIYGAGATVVSVQAEFDLDSLSTVSKTQRPTSDPIVSHKTTETMRGEPGGVKPGGLAGAASNLAAPTTRDTPPGGNDSAYKNQMEDVQRGIDEIDTTSEKVPGSVKSLVVNVAADSNRIKDPTEQANLKKWVEDEANKTGDPQRNVASVTYIAFDTSASAEAAKAQAAAATQSRLQQILAAAPVLVLVVIAAMVMRQVGKISKAAAPALALQQAQFMALPDGMGTVDSSASDLLAALGDVNVTHSHGEDGESVHILGEEDDELNVDSIKNKVHMPLEQLKKMAHERPAVFSMLVKSLLLEDRK